MVKQSKNIFVLVLLCPEDKGTVIIQICGNNGQSETASHFRESYSSAAPLWESEILLAKVSTYTFQIDVNFTVVISHMGFFLKHECKCNKFK